MGCSSIGQRDRGGTEDAYEHRQPDAEHCPVESNPPVGVDGTYGAHGGQRGKADGHADRHQRAEEHRAENAD